jgi:hypothetical protein
MVLLAAALLTRENMLALQRCGVCAGVLLADTATPPPEGFSPAAPLPYCQCGVAPPCGPFRWNPVGSGLLDLSFDFPIVRLNHTQADELRRRAARSVPELDAYPQYKTKMHFYMDAYQGFFFEDSRWWEEQPNSRCCQQCRPNCGSACCAQGFTCLSKDSGTGGHTLGIN